MKKKGGLLNDFKLYYEDVPNTPRYKPSITKKRPEGAKKRAVGDNLHARVSSIIALYVVASGRREIRNRSAMGSKRLPATVYVDDRKTMPKVPLSNKKRTAKSSRQKVV